MTDDILIAVSKGASRALDRQNKGALVGIEVETNPAGLRITAGDYDLDNYEDKDYYQTELSIPWIDLLWHAPTEILYYVYGMRRLAELLREEEASNIEQGLRLLFE